MNFSTDWSIFPFQESGIFEDYPDKSFDGRGNYSLGIKEQIIFPEINVDNVSKISGMDITFVTTAKTDEEAYSNF